MKYNPVSLLGNRYPTRSNNRAGYTTRSNSCLNMNSQC